MSVQAQVLYDFESQPESGELTIHAGEMVTVTRQDVGEGWWEGVNSYGQTGLFPETYVQILSAPGSPPAMPPPPLPAGYDQNVSSTGQNGYSGGGNDEWYNPTTAASSANQNAQSGPVTSASSNSIGQAAEPRRQMEYAPPPPAPNDYDDDWSDDESLHNQEEAKVTLAGDGKEPLIGHISAPAGGGHINRLRRRSSSREEESRTDPLSNREDAAPSSGGHQLGSSWGSNKEREVGRSLSAEPGRGTVKKNINRFTNFVKSGTEAYIIDNLKGPLPKERYEVVADGGGHVQWAPSAESYSVRVDSPKKSSKLKGLKSFIAYQLTPSFNNIQVSRRFKHFDWLHQRLVEKFSCFLPIPPLPDKQVTGRYEDEFIEHRMAILQVWVNKICRHPVLSQCDVWKHFITCTDEKRWKTGKRDAEKDEFVGGRVFLSIVIPEQPLEINDIETRIENFGKMARSLDDSVKAFYNMASESSKKMQGPYKREYMKIGTAFRSLGASFELDTSSTSSQEITNAVRVTGDAYDLVGQMFEQQPKIDLEPLMGSLFAYKGILQAVPEMISTHRSALAKLRDHQKLYEDGKITQSEMEGIRQRVDVISYAMLAEMSHFQIERVHDFGDMLTTFLGHQVNFYNNVVTKLQETLHLYSSYHR